MFFRAVLTVPALQVECDADCASEQRLLLGEQEPDLPPERAGRNSRDVVEGDDARVIEAVRGADGHLGGEPARRRRDRRDGDVSQVRAHELAGQHDDRSRLVELRDMDRTHQSTGRPWAHAAS